MKKTLLTLVAAALVFTAIPAVSAQTISRHHFKKDARAHKRIETEEDKNIYERHRNVFNIAIGAGAGTILGAIFGGKKGALIGAGVGAGAAAAYTYGINPKDEERDGRWYRHRRQ